jgi:hypothetical protein
LKFQIAVRDLISSKVWSSDGILHFQLLDDVRREPGITTPITSERVDNELVVDNRLIQGYSSCGVFYTRSQAEQISLAAVMAAGNYSLRGQ